LLTYYESLAVNYLAVVRVAGVVGVVIVGELGKE
jgi:hypothetical protein